MALQVYNSYSNESLASNAEWVHVKSGQVGSLVVVEIKSYHGHRGSIKTCQFIEEKNWILTGADDNTARLWDFHTGREIQKYELHHTVTAVSAVRINQDTTRLYSSSWDKTRRCFDIETGHEIWKGIQDDMITSCQISHDDSSLCTGTDQNGIISIWDARIGLLKISIRHIHDSIISSCQFNMSDDRIISTSFDKTSKIFDLIAHRTTMTLRDHQNVVSNCSFDQYERLYATCSWDKTILLYDITTGRFRHQGPFMLSQIHEGSIAACYMSKDRKLLVTGGYDMKVVLWDLENMLCKLILRGHRDWVNDVCLTNDHKWIISVSNDCDVRLWHIENCDTIKQIIEQNNIPENMKTAACFKCGKIFPINKLQRDQFSSMFSCVFCNHEPNQNQSIEH